MLNKRKIIHIMNFVTSREAQDYFRISAQTLKLWKDAGKINFKKFTRKMYLYDIDSFNDNGAIQQEDVRKNVIYARVSSTSQKKSLENQIELVKNYCLSNGITIDEVYSEIASGLNDNRLQLSKLIKDVASNQIKTIYISFKDRLTRFGFGYFETFFKNFNTKIVIIDKLGDSTQDSKKELIEDLIAIIHHYSTKLYSNRRKSIKRIEEELSNLEKTQEETC